jgi:hypothetical protein
VDRQDRVKNFNRQRNLGFSDINEDFKKAEMGNLKKKEKQLQKKKKNIQD